MTGRVLLGAGGVAVAAYGGFLLLSRQEPDQLVGAATWLALGVLLHDLVLVPLTLLVAWVGIRLLPPGARGPAAVVLVVLGSVTLLAVPVLGGFGRRPDNPTLLDRDYTAGWLVLAGLVLGIVLVGSLLGRLRGRPARRAPDTPRHRHS